jgi:hypothetical protein
MDVAHAGPAASTVNIVSVTSAQSNPVIAAPVIGLVPIFPVIAEVGTSVIPDFDRVAKLPADPSSTGACPAIPGEALESNASSAAIRLMEICFFDVARFGRVGVLTVCFGS